jgi:hypothetical protein
MWILDGRQDGWKLMEVQLGIWTHATKQLPKAMKKATMKA